MIIVEFGFAFVLTVVRSDSCSCVSDSDAHTWIPVLVGFLLSVGLIVVSDSYSIKDLRSCWVFALVCINVNSFLMHIHLLLECLSLLY